MLPGRLRSCIGFISTWQKAKVPEEPYKRDCKRCVSRPDGEVKNIDGRVARGRRSRVACRDGAAALLSQVVAVDSHLPSPRGWRRIPAWQEQYRTSLHPSPENAWWITNNP